MATVAAVVGYPADAARADAVANAPVARDNESAGGLNHHLQDGPPHSKTTCNELLHLKLEQHSTHRLENLCNYHAVCLALFAFFYRDTQYRGML